MVGSWLIACYYNKYRIWFGTSDHIIVIIPFHPFHRCTFWNVLDDRQAGSSDCQINKRKANCLSNINTYIVKHMTAAAFLTPSDWHCLYIFVSLKVHIYSVCSVIAVALIISLISCQLCSSHRMCSLLTILLCCWMHSFAVFFAQHVSNTSGL